MSYEYETETLDDGVLTVAVQGWDEGYVLWQKPIEPSSGEIYFEYDDQINGGYNTVKECTVTSDGIHIVLSNGKLAHFYFIKGFDKFAELKEGLLKIYGGSEHVVLEFSI